MAGEKTEKPTERRKKQAREEGRVARTPDLGAWGGMFAASMLIPMVGRTTLERTGTLMTQVAEVIANPEPDRVMHVLKAGLAAGAIAVAPLSVGLLLIGIAAAGVQGGLRPAMKLLKPNFSRLNLGKGLQRTFGGFAAWEALKAVAKTVVVGIVLYISVRGLVTALLTAGTIPLPTLLSKVADAVLNVIRTAAFVGLALAAADYAVARRRVGKQIRMSKEEVKEENRRTEGDPHVKSAIRSKQMAISRQRMMAELPKADVVLVNPTHVAVALRYDPAKGAPRVIAKGAGAVAAKIREKATEHRIPMVHDVALARALYQACELGQEIAPHFYEAVARVLAFVMMLKAKGSAAGTHRNLRAAA